MYWLLFRLPFRIQPQQVNQIISPAPTTKSAKDSKQQHKNLPKNSPGRRRRLRRATTLGCRPLASSSEGPPRPILRDLPTGLPCLERAIVRALRMQLCDVYSSLLLRISMRE